MTLNLLCPTCSTNLNQHGTDRGECTNLLVTDFASQINWFIFTHTISIVCIVLYIDIKCKEVLISDPWNFTVVWTYLHEVEHGTHVHCSLDCQLSRRDAQLLWMGRSCVSSVNSNNYFQVSFGLFYRVIVVLNLWNKKAFQSSANSPFFDSLYFILNKFECVWGGGCRAGTPHSEFQVEHVWTCLGCQGPIQGLLSRGQTEWQVWLRWPGVTISSISIIQIYLQPRFAVFLQVWQEDTELCLGQDSRFFVLLLLFSRWCSIPRHLDFDLLR